METPPVRTAILSYGMSGEIFHAPLLSALKEFDLAMIVSRTSPKAATHFPSAKVVSSVDDVLKDNTIELVIVNTPNETHLDFATRALESGKHVVVEKPFTVTVREADQLIALAKQHRRVLTVFQNRRWDSDFLTVKKVLKEGELGKIVEFEAHYDRFRNYIESNTWKEERTSGTGIVYNLGSHMLDQVVALFGMPEYVDARIGIQRPGGRVDDYYDIRLEYKEHLVIVKSSYLVKEPLPRYIIHGVNGSFVKYGIDPQEQSLKEKQSPLEPGWGQEPDGQWGKMNILKNNLTIERRIPSEAGNYLAFYHNVFEAIRHAAPLQVTAEQARDVIHLIEKSYESSKSRSAVRLCV